MTFDGLSIRWFHGTGFAKLGGYRAELNPL
jgi:hypothetical protein